MEGMKKIDTARSPKTPRDHSSPTFEQLLHGESSVWPSPKTGREHYQEGNSGHQNRKSVLTKVKEKAKKLKHSLSKKKHNHEDTGSPSSPVILEDDQEDDNAPEFLGAPMYESEQAPKDCKETIRQQPRVVPIVSEKHILPTSIIADNETKKGNKIEQNNENEKAQIRQTYTTVTNTEPGDVSGSYNGVQTVEKGEKQIWDKGVSVKEYLMQKLEPGENERALSEVITETISPRENTQMGVVEMVKEAITSFLRNDDMASQSSPIRNEETVFQPTIASSSPAIPVSTHPQESEAVSEEENHGRILQTN